ncbi:MAG TPA: hypothetical protein VE959_00895 [Bryobacteraceae bacterium]|nr:hypothetical protein [Bryobacteraceae bacterium]
MVNLDITRGSELLDTLERAKLKVSVALWMYLSEYEDWRLVVSTRQFDSLDLRAAYRLLNDSLAAAGFTPEKTPPIMILPMADPLIRELRRLFGKTKSVEGMRLGGQMIGDRFVQDAYVYRIS